MLWLWRGLVDGRFLPLLHHGCGHLCGFGVDVDQVVVARELCVGLLVGQAAYLIHTLQRRVHRRRVARRLQVGGEQSLTTTLMIRCTTMRSRTRHTKPDILLAHQ